MFNINIVSESESVVRLRNQNSAADLCKDHQILHKKPRKLYIVNSWFCIRNPERYSSEILYRNYCMLVMYVSYKISQKIKENQRKQKIQFSHFMLGSSNNFVTAVLISNLSYHVRISRNPSLYENIKRKPIFPQPLHCSTKTNFLP